MHSGDINFSLFYDITATLHKKSLLQKMM